MLPSQQPQPREPPASTAPALDPTRRRKKSQRASSSVTRQSSSFTPVLDRSTQSATGISQHNGDDDAAAVDAVLARSLSEVSLGLEQGGVRSWRILTLVHAVVESDWFNNGIISLIVLNSIILACYDPSQSAESSRNAWIDMSDYLFQAMFTLEAILRMAHLGCRGYFRDPLNVCDFVLVVLGFAEYMNAFDAAFAKVFRAFRVLRSFRLLKHIPGMVILLEIISRSYAQLLTVLWLSSFIVFSFGILGVELFKDVPLDTDQFSSVVGFQNILQSFCTLFIVLGREGWVEIADWIEQALPNSSIYFIVLTAFGSVLVLNLIVTVLVLNYKNNRHHALALHHNDLYSKLAPIVAKTAERKLLQDGFKAEVSAIHLMRIFEQKHGQTNVLSLDEYLKLRKRYGAQYRKWCKDKKIALQRYDSMREPTPTSQEENDNANDGEQGASFAQGVQPPFFFEAAVALVILFFTVANVLPHFLQPLETASTVRVISLCCGALFVVELIARIAWARGLVNALRGFSKSQIVDGILVLIGLPLLFTGVFQSLLVLRIPKVLSLRDRYASTSPTLSNQSGSLTDSNGEAEGEGEGMFGQMLVRVKKGLLAQRFEMLKGSLLQVAPFSLILFLFMHIFAVTGLYLFGETFITSADLSTAALGYGSYLRAFVTTFQVLTGEGWNTLMYEAVKAFGPWSVLYYVLLLTLGNFVFLNLLLAIFIDAYINGKPETDDSALSQPSKKDAVKHQVRALKAQMVRQDSARTQSSSERPLTSPLHRLRPDGRSKTFFRRKVYEVVCWMHQHFALDVFGFVVTVVYAFGFPANESVGHACLVMMYLESVARLAIGDIDKIYLADAVAVVLASSHWWFIRNAFTLSLRSVVVVRLLRWDHNVQRMIRSFGKSLPGCIVLCATAYIIFSAFAAISVERYAGKFMVCAGEANNKTCFDFANVTNAEQYDLAPCAPEQNCYDGKGRFEWRNPDDGSGVEVMNFDAYGPAMRAIFEMATLEAWNEAMLRGTQITRVGQAPEDGSSEYDSLFFILLVCVGHLLILQLFIAIMIETFLFEELSQKGSDLLSASQLSWVENQVQTIFQDPRRKPPGEDAGGSREGLRQRCFRVVDSRRFERAICCAVLLDALLMATQYYGEPDWKTQALAASQAAFAALYMVEAGMKMVAYGKAYFLSARHLFDLAIAILAVLSTVSFYTNGFIPNLTSLRVLRIAWVFPSLRAFLQLLGRAVPAMLRVLRVFLMLLYVYMFAGMALCSESSMFGSIASAARTWYIVAIGDNWTGVLKQLETECGSYGEWARFLVISYVFCVTFVVMNLLIAVMLQVFEQEFLRNSLDQLSMAKYRREWFKFMRKRRTLKQQRGGAKAEKDREAVSKSESLQPAPGSIETGSRQRNGSKSNTEATSLTPSRPGKPEAVERNSREPQPSLNVSTGVDVGLERKDASNGSSEVVNKVRAKVGKLRSCRGSYMSPELFPELLVKLKPPLGLVDFSAGIYTQRELLQLIHLANIPITQDNMLNFNSVLFALSEFRYRMNTGEEIPRNLKEVALRLHLSGSWREKFEAMIAESNKDYQLSHFIAATIIQGFFRMTRKHVSPEAKVVHNVMGVFGWGQSRSALNVKNCEVSSSDDDDGCTNLNSTAHANGYEKKTADSALAIV